MVVFKIKTMLPYNQITSGKYIEINGEPCEVMNSRVFRKQQRKAVNQTKLKNLITGKITERTFQQSEKVEEVDMGLKEIIFVYEKNGSYTFHSAGDKSDRFCLDEKVVGGNADLLKSEMEVLGIVYKNTIIGLRLPIKADYKVVEAPPNIKGNTAQGGNKQVVIESGAKVEAPMFIDVGDVIKVNTQNKSYDTRTSKKRS